MPCGLGAEQSLARPVTATPAPVHRQVLQPEKPSPWVLPPGSWAGGQLRAQVNREAQVKQRGGADSAHLRTSEARRAEKLIKIYIPLIRRLAPVRKLITVNSTQSKLLLDIFLEH